MFERVAIIVTVAFILTRFKFFQDMFHHDYLSKHKELAAIIFFGLFGIVATYFGVSFNTESLRLDRVTMELVSDEAIANSRVIAIAVAGLLGGYRVGVGAGLIAGVHRLTLGGFTAVACSVATVISGAIAGFFYKRDKHIKLPTAFVIGAASEALQMGIILTISKPFTKALTLVEVIGMPMILANGVGTALFLLIVQNVVHEEEKATAQQAQKTLRIADQTLGYLRKGMTNASALAVCNILFREIEPSAVAMTNQTHILAHVGEASDHHQANMPLQTHITEQVIREGELVVADEEVIHCRHEDCSLGAAVIAPLKQRNETIGTLKLYYATEEEITDVVVELVSGLSSLLSNQLEIAEADRAYQLAKEAEIKALQAQISPHFLFNTINIIISLIRIDPEQARELLMSLSYFLRQNLEGTTADLITLEQELSHVKAYLKIEKARFIDKLDISYTIDEHILTEHIPPLTLQPIVENAIKHGIKDMEKGCLINISVRDQAGQIEITVEDNGKGMDAKRRDSIGKKRLDSDSGTGMGLYNVNRRLIMTFGEESRLIITSQPERGTAVSFSIPKKEVRK